MKDSEERRAELYSLLGRLPDRRGVPKARLVDRRKGEGYVRETLRLDLNGEEPVSAYLLLPKGRKGPFPTILYNHAHRGAYEVGKEELLTGTSLLEDPPYGPFLTSLGFAVLAIDHWCFGERSRNKELYLFKRTLWEGRVLWGMMVYDSLRAIDYLLTRPEVDRRRLGTIGFSMGSTMAWWLAALEPRISLCIDICCLTDFHALVESGGLGRHGIYYYVPSLLTAFTTSDVNVLIAPRLHLSLAGTLDPLTPVTGLDRIDVTVSRRYRELGVPERWRLLRYPVGHGETREMRQNIQSWLESYIAGAG